MATYRDSIHDPYNDAGGDAVFRIRFLSRLFPTIEAAVRGGLTPEEVVGIVAICAVDAAVVEFEAASIRPDSIPAVLDCVVEYLDDARADGVSTAEAIGFILSAAQDAAASTSLSLRFEPRPH